MNKTKKKIVAITTYLVYDLFIDLFQYISQFIVANEEKMQHPMMIMWLKILMEL